MAETTWGIRFNEYPNYQRFHKGNKPEGCPEWLESHRISIWQEQGLIIWKSDGVSVARLVHLSYPGSLE